MGDLHQSSRLSQPPMATPLQHHKGGSLHGYNTTQARAKTSPHSYLSFHNIEEFARRQGVKVVDNQYFITLDNFAMLKLAKEANIILILDFESCDENIIAYIPPIRQRQSKGEK
ncbi:hypothetical protein Fmac_018568 [Flemingia macrophylla]|uniref:Uncharacterized protein n=1 Tax=Flemingia macrophylla TaxID=520843 RepID=A0ABD1M5C2_9FABA